jgi:hypothetical protein
MHEFDINLQITFFWAFWYVICIFRILYELIMDFTSSDIFWKRETAEYEICSVKLFEKVSLNLLGSILV